jgi:hypothetical protein
MAHLVSQRRSIPSVFVDTSIDPNHLTLKDCFSRRSSTGRALPQVPLEQVNIKLCTFFSASSPAIIHNVTIKLLPIMQKLLLLIK